MTNSTRTLTPGTVLRHDFQADVFRGEYVLVEPVAGKPGHWVVEALAPSTEIIEAILEHAISCEASGTNPYFAGCHRDAAGNFVEGTYETEIAEREARAGERSTYRFVSSAEYHAAF